MTGVRVGALSYEFDNVLFAAECLLEVRDRYEVSEIADKLLSRLKELSNVNKLFSSPSYDFIYITAIKVIANTWKGDPEVLSWLKSCALSHEDAEARFVAIQGIGQGWKNEYDTFIWLKNQTLNEDPVVRFACLSIIGKEWGHDIDALALLKYKAQDDENPGVRKIALEGLLSGWINESGMVEFFFDRAANDPCEQKEEHLSEWENPRRVALKAIIQFYPEHPNALTFLFKRVLYEPDPTVRSYIIQEIVKGWPDFPDLLSWLKNLAEKDGDPQVRQIAAQEIVKGWPDFPDLLSWLKNIAETDEDSWVREFAALDVIKHWQNVSGILFWLKNLIQAEENLYVKQRLITELAQGWYDEPEILPWLKEWAQSDPLPLIRIEAIKAYAWVMGNQPEVFDFLCNCAVHDPFQYQNNNSLNPRMTAFELLFEHCSDHPQILPFLREIVEKDPEKELSFFLIHEIYMRWHNAPNVVQWLKNIAETDNEITLRRVIMTVLAQGWEIDPENLSWLKKLVEKSEDENSRAIGTQVLDDLFDSLYGFANNVRMREKEEVNSRLKALAILANYYKDIPASFHLLVRSVKEDPDARIRQFALKELIENWNNIHGMVDFLYECTMRDPFQRQDVDETNPRRTAIEAFVKYFSDDPRLSQLLSDRKEHDPDQALRKFAKEQIKIMNKRKLNV